MHVYYACIGTILDYITNMESIDNQHTSLSGDSTNPEFHRVLLVDDEASIRFAYQQMLRKERFLFDVCETTDEATVLIKKNSYFAIISDVRFAGSSNKDGVLLVATIRMEQPQAEVILVTGYGNEELKRTVTLLGASHYYEKPVEPSLILSLLRALHLVADERERDETTCGLLVTGTAHVA